MATGRLLHALRFREVNDSGGALSGGKVYFYEAGTDTPKSAWTDRECTVAHPSPLVLDSNGMVPNDGEIWLSGFYKIRLHNSADVLQDEVDYVEGGADQATIAAVQASAYSYAADSALTDAYAVALDPPVAALTDGMLVAFRANTANAGPSTLAVNGLAAKALKKNFDEDTVTGDIKAGQAVVVRYDSSQDAFQIVSHTRNILTARVTAEQSFVQIRDDVGVVLAGGTSAVTNNAYRDGATWKYAGDGVASLATFSGQDLILYYAETGSAGGTIAWIGPFTVWHDASFPIYGGEVAADGTAVNLPAGWTSARTSNPGVYQVTHNLGTTGYVVVVTSGVTDVVPFIQAKAANSFTIENRDPHAAQRLNAGFDFLLRVTA